MPYCDVIPVGEDGRIELLLLRELSKEPLLILLDPPVEFIYQRVRRELRRERKRAEERGKEAKGGERGEGMGLLLLRMLSKEPLLIHRVRGRKEERGERRERRGWESGEVENSLPEGK